MIKISDEAIERIADDIASRIKGEWQIEDGWGYGSLGHERFWNDYIKRTDPHEEQYREILRKLLQKQANEVFENIKRYPKKPKKWTFDRKQSLRELTEAEAKFITKLIKQEGQKAIDLALKLAKVQKGLKVSPAVGITFDIENPLVIETLTKQTTRFPAGLVNTTEEEIRGAIAAGTREGENVEKLADRVQEKLGPASITNRAMLIARTETMYAANAGAELGYVQSGVVEGKQWLIAWDERTCDICLDMEGMTAPVGQPTWEKEGMTIGDVQSNYGLKFDYTEGEMPFPPIHPRCRCTIIPILKTVYREGFKPAKTIREAEKYITEKLHLTGANYGNMNLQVVNEVNKTLVGLQKKYPRINLGIIDFKKAGDPSYFGHMSHVPYLPVGEKTSRGMLILNSEYNGYGTVKEFNQLMQQSFKAGYNASASLADVVTHEMGHALTFTNFTFADVGELRLYHSEMKVKKVLTGISKYAEVNFNESLAEAFVKYNRGDKLPPKALEALREWLGVK